MKERLTEEQLSAVFEAIITNGGLCSPYPRFAHVLREMDCQQGRPDFVASPTKATIIPRSLRVSLASALATPSTARTLSLLKPVAPRSVDYILRASGLSLPVVRRSISALESLNLVSRYGQSGYVLSPEFPEMRWEFWAFEVKVDNWRRVLYQALQCKAFAHRVIVVISEDWAHRLERHIE